ncbi:hypothetical protein ACNVED_12065 [Legionella sp. D16C41]|uniref:hypothetical protein n=1 Tax=Legionella sp. D16C41 TaxID=3402688 RepID=UPI003AF7E52C
MNDAFIIPYLNQVAATSIPYENCMLTNIVDHIGDVLKADAYVAYLVEAVWAAYTLKQKFATGLTYLDQVEIPSLYKQSDSLDSNMNFLDIYNHFTAKAMLKKVDKIITTDEPLQNLIQEEYSFKDIISIANYPYYHKLRVNNQASIRKLCSATDSDILILYPNSIDSTSQFEIIILDWLAQLPLHFKMVFVGFIPSNYLQELNSYVEKTGIRDRITFLGECEHSSITELYSGADFSFICLNPENPPNYLALSNTIFDCINARLPILSYDVPTHKFYIEQYKIGEVFSLEEQPAQVPNIIKQFASKLAIYRNNLENAASSLTWEAQEDKFLRFIGYPKTVTFIGKYDLSNNSRTLRMAQTLVNLGTKVNIVTTNDPKEPIKHINYYNIHTYFRQYLST